MLVSMETNRTDWLVRAPRIVCDNTVTMPVRDIVRADTGVVLGSIAGPYRVCDNTLVAATAFAAQREARELARLVKVQRKASRKRSRASRRTNR